MFKVFKSSPKMANTGSIMHEEFFNDLRSSEFKRLDDNQHVYLDYTGGNLYPESLVTNHLEQLKNGTFGNPHSTNPTSMSATKLVEEARQAVLDFFNADDYYCVFTSNASNALKIVGECYPFDKDGEFLLIADNHNSVNGIREYCRKKGGRHEYFPIQYEDLKINKEILSERLNNGAGKNRLFAFPAQSNVTGVKHSLELVSEAKSKGWDVLLDAAAFVPTSTLDLSRVHPDFVSISFYKIFGYPTGLGCLLIHKESFNKLEKPWFAGGTVSLVSVASSDHFLIANHERFENGTINYLGIPALKTGLDFMKEIGMDRLSQRVKSLIDYLKSELRTIKHDNNKEVVRVFGPADGNDQGGTIIVKFFNTQGESYNFEKIENMTNERNISIRSGCFCNPGIDEVNNCLTTDEISNYFNSRDSGDYHDMIKALNKMRGATRISVGLATTKNDLDSFIDFVKDLRNK